MKKRSITALLILFCIVVALAFSASAAETTAEINEGKSSTLTLKYTKGTTKLANTTFSLYKVGKPQKNAGGGYSFELNDSFKNAGVSQLPDLSFWSESDANAKNTRDKADTLVKHVDKNNIAAAKSATTNINGEALFSGLEAGLYLVRGGREEEHGTIPQSFLIPLPYPTKDQKTNEDAFSYKMIANVKPENAGIYIKEQTQWLNEFGIPTAERPDGGYIEVRLSNDTTIRLDASNNWGYDSPFLTYRSDWDAYYRQSAEIIENTLVGWQVTATPVHTYVDDGKTVTITYRIELQKISFGSVVNVYTQWLDASGNPTNERPDSGYVKVQLSDNMTVTLDAAGNWSYSTSMDYKIEEQGYWKSAKILENTLNGWQVTATPERTYVDGGNTASITYRIELKKISGKVPDTVTASVKKVWADSGDHDPVTVQLYRDNVLFGEQVLNRDNGWSYEWTGLETGHDWRVNEVNIPDGYTATVNKSQSENKLEFTITNTRSDTKPPDEQNTITVKKVWAGSGTHPVSVTVQLYRDGTLFGEQTLNNGNGWSYTWTTTAGEHAWSVEEVNAPNGYTVNIAWAGNTATVTNTRSNTQTPSGPTSPPADPNNPPGPGSPPGNPDDPSRPNSPPGNPDDPSGPNSPPSNPDNPSGPSSPPNNPNDPGTPPDDPSLPQTGQLWWPVPLLAVAGVLLLLIGAALFLRKEDPHE